MLIDDDDGEFGDSWKDESEETKVPPYYTHIVYWGQAFNKGTELGDKEGSAMNLPFRFEATKDGDQLIGYVSTDNLDCLEDLLESLLITYDIDHFAAFDIKDLTEAFFEADLSDYLSVCLKISLKDKDIGIEILVGEDESGAIVFQDLVASWDATGRFGESLEDVIENQFIESEGFEDERWEEFEEEMFPKIQAWISKHQDELRRKIEENKRNS